MRTLLFWVVVLLFTCGIAYIAHVSAVVKCDARGVELGADARYVNGACVVKGWGRVF